MQENFQDCRVNRGLLQERDRREGGRNRRVWSKLLLLAEGSSSVRLIPQTLGAPGSSVS